ncbi:MAG: amidinotransferase [Bacteroidetes bacterium]|nr:amidinotransferase [Bacteroidota bacterium]
MPERSSSILSVSSEITPLRRVLIHSPDSGLGKVVPSMAQDWLFEDIIHLDTIRRKEYDYFVKVLMYFLDRERIQGRLEEIDSLVANRAFYKPGAEGFHRSDKVLELQEMLQDVLADAYIRDRLLASVCAIEGCAYSLQQSMQGLSPESLAQTFITGTRDDQRMIFPPLPNLIFTRDIGIVINQHILLNRPARKARYREALLMKYIFFNHPVFAHSRDKILEIPDTLQHFLLPLDSDEARVTLEGGDVMVVAPQHVLIGVSERTSIDAARQAIMMLFERGIVEKATLVQIPKKREYMHIDTLFTQVKRNVWVMLGHFSRNPGRQEFPGLLSSSPFDKRKEDPLRILQFHRNAPSQPLSFEHLEDLLDDISRNDLGAREETMFICSGNNEFPFDAREQWTDSCNLLALREGVVLGYDRNDKTIEAFRQNGFHTIGVQELINQFEAGTLDPDHVRDTLILMPSAELSRARGGFHCMSMPLYRDHF